MANETVFLDLGPSHPGVVVRLPPLEPTFPDYDLTPQALVQNAVAAAGVPAPAPAVVVDDPAWIGTPFLVMPRVLGDIPGPAPVFDPYVRDGGPAFQRVMHDGFVDTLAAIHAVPWEAAGLDAALPGPGLRDALDRWSAYVDWASEGDPLPALAQALDWCTRHAPPERAPALLWGDVRLGNLVFDEARAVVAVLDWDLASIGPPEMDLGWHLGLEFMMEELFGRRVAGFPVPPRDARALRGAPVAARCTTSPGTRCSRWCAPSPSTTGTSASRATRAGSTTRWAASSRRVWRRLRRPGSRPVPPGRFRRADAAASPDVHAVTRRGVRARARGARSP